MIKQSPKLYEYYHQKSDTTVFLRPVNLAFDFEQLYYWTHQTHVIPHWKLNKPKMLLHQHFRKALEDRHQLLMMIAIEDQLIGYAEVYYAPHDRLANFCQLQSGDYGLHLFIGSPHAVGKGYSERILAALTDYLFNDQKAHRVLVEPNQNVQQLTLLERKLGFDNLGQLRLPEKTAILYAIKADAFYHRTPKCQKTPPASLGITNDVSDWPIVRIYFPNYPADDLVITWLDETTQLFSRNEPCIVISTFAEHYQFSPEARKIQAIWFKQHRHQLARSCIAMIRVTQDRTMIAKMTSKAMRRGMPFICIPAHSITEADRIAYRLLNKYKKMESHNDR